MSLATFDSRIGLPHPDFVTRVSALASTWQRRARQRAELARLNERDLHDLGLSRADVEYEVRKPFWHG